MKRTDMIVSRICAYFDQETRGLSRADYTHVVEGVASMMDGAETNRIMRIALGMTRKEAS